MDPHHFALRKLKPPKNIKKNMVILIKNRLLL
jgi:hypothetical protein